MKKTIVLLFLLVSLAASAEGTGLFLTGNLDYSLSVYNNYFSPSVAFYWQPGGVFGIGAEVKSYMSPYAGDIYLAAMVLGKLWWMDLGVGVSFTLRQPDPVTPALIAPTNEFLPYLRLGLTAPVFQLGPGKLGFNASLDFVSTAFPPYVPEDVDSIGDFIGQIFVMMIVVPFQFVANYGKLSAGVNYTIEF